MQVFAITGITGLLAQNFLFEIIKNNKSDLSKIRLILFGRSLKNDDIKKRILEIIDRELSDYISEPGLNLNYIKEWLDESVIWINYELDKENLAISESSLKILKNQNIDFFYHVAALTDFRNNQSAIKVLNKINILGTKRILELVSLLNIQEFVYVSSAYACGKTTGNIDPDYINLDQDFRNHYERTKLEAEILVRNFVNKNNLKFRIFRPSTISGRLMEKELGSVSKIDVFYQWCSFFYRYKQKMLNKQECINDKFEIDLRFYYSKESGLNIVPADYIAKMMYYICVNNCPGESFHLVNNQETSHELYTKIMLDCINISGISYSNKIPEQQNNLEKLYYKTVGQIYTPYIISKPILFNTDNTKKISVESKINCPAVDEKNFSILMDFVTKRNFLN